MEVVYNVIVNIKIVKGMLEIGSFFLGDDIDFASGVFNNLKGDPEVKDDTVMRLDLVKKEENDLPLLLYSKSCTLDEYTENCKIISREVFKFFTLEK